MIRNNTPISKDEWKRIVAVVSAAAACSPPAPMKHFVNESSDVGFSLEVFPVGGVQK